MPTGEANFVGKLFSLLPTGCGGRGSEETQIDEDESSKECKDVKEKSTSQDEKQRINDVYGDFRSNDTYQHIKDFEEGDEGHCSVVRSQTTGRLFAMKHTRSFAPTKSNNSEQTGRRKPVPNEARILQKVQPHPNIIHFFGIEQSPLGPDRHLIFTEFCSGGDLLDQLKKFQGLKIRTPEVFTLHVLVSLADALAYLHHGLRQKEGSAYDKNNDHATLIHGDIKPDNIFLRWPGKEIGLPDVVLANFGMAQVAAESLGITGTSGYDSPEVREVALLRDVAPAAYERRKASRIMTAKSDIYQYGLILHLLATGGHFDTGSDPSSISLPLPHQSVTGLIALIVWCLQPDPAERPECTSSLEHGILFAVEMFRKKRDASYAMIGGFNEKIWNVSELRDECMAR